MMSSNPSLKKVSEDEFYAEPSFVSTLTPQELHQHIEQTRQRISSNLDQLEDKANVPKQLGKARDRLQAKFTEIKRDQPLLLAGIGLGAVVAAAAIITAVVKANRR